MVIFVWINFILLTFPPLAFSSGGGIKCGYKQTSCPDQLSRALTIALREAEKRRQA